MKEKAAWRKRQKRKPSLPLNGTVSATNFHEFPSDDAPGAFLNLFRITGRLIAREALRYTPAGIPAVTGQLAHSSEQEEAGGVRQVECEVPLLALGDAAKWLAAAAPGMEISLTGFIAAKSKNSKTLVFHVQFIEFLEGKKNG